MGEHWSRSGEGCRLSWSSRIAEPTKLPKKIPCAKPVARPKRRPFANKGGRSVTRPPPSVNVLATIEEEAAAIHWMINMTHPDAPVCLAAKPIG